MSEEGIKVAFTGVPAKIRHVAGEEAARLILETYGGGRIYIPVRATPRHKLAQLVGIEAAHKITANVHHGEYEIQARRGAAPSLKQRILAASGTTLEIAKNLGCSERHVRRIRNMTG